MNQKFSNRGHILASVGAAVGVANLVLFPARMQNYGGIAFLIVFVLCTFIYGVPLMIAETNLGKSGQSDAVRSFEKIGGKAWGKVGMFGIITTWFILSFYIIISGWAFYYLFLYVFDFNSMTQVSAGELFGGFVVEEDKVIMFSGIAMLVTMIVVAQNIQSGIEWIGKRFVPLLIVLVVGLIVSFPFLERVSLNYDNFYLDFGKMFSITENGKLGLIEAMGQAFFSLSLGACGMVTYGSHLNKKTDVVSNSRYIVHTDTFVAILAAFLVIPLFGASDNVNASPALVFIYLVETFNQYGPTVGRGIGIVFFVLFNIAILTSSISIMEPGVRFLRLKYGGGRAKYAYIIGTGIFILSLPAIYSIDPTNSSWFTNFLGYGDGANGEKSMGYFNFVLDFFGTFCLIIGSLLLAIFIRKKWGRKSFFKELELVGVNYSEWYKSLLFFILSWVVPVTMGILIVGEFIKLSYKIGWIG